MGASNHSTRYRVRLAGLMSRLTATPDRKREAAPRSRVSLEPLEGREVPAVIDVPLVSNGVPDHVLVRPMGANVDVVVNGALRHRVADGTDLTVRILGSGDADWLTVHTGVRALVTFDGRLGADSLTVVGTAAADGIALSANAVTINATRVHFSDVQGVAVNAGAGDDRVSVAGTAAGVTAVVNGEAGNDTVLVGLNLDVTGTTFTATLDPFAGALRVNGGAGVSDRVVVNDAASAAGHAYTLGGGSGGAIDRWGLSRGPRQVFDYLNLDALSVSSTQFADSMDVTGTQPGLDLRIDGWSGLDTLTGSNLRNYYFVTGIDSGAHSGTGSPARFTSYENLTGGGGEDHYYIGAGGRVTGRIDGRGGPNSLSYTRTAVPSFIAPIADYAGNVRVDLTLGTATAVTGGVRNVQSVYGSSGDDVLLGNALANRLEGRGGNDTISGNGGDDILLGHDGADAIKVRTSAGRAYVYGGGGDDVIEVGAGRLLASPAGSLTIDAGPGTDEVRFDDSANTTDRAYTLAATATVGLGTFGYDGANRASFQGAERLFLSAGSGDDTVNATGVPAGSYWWVNGGAHRLRGDTYTGGNRYNWFWVQGPNRGKHNQSDFVSFENLLGMGGDDNFILLADASLTGWIDGGGSGNDTLSYTQIHADMPVGDYGGNVRVNLLTGEATAIRGGGIGGVRRLHNVIGSSRDDVLIGNALANRLEGRGGHDRLEGGSGNDWLYGGDGNDTISGGAGYDWAYGGPGSDILHPDNERRS